MADEREQEIRERAYRIWQDEGEPAGREQDHWSRAQAEVEGGGENGLISGQADDLPFGEPEDTGAADAKAAQGADEIPQVSGVAAAAGTPIAPAPKSSGKPSK